MVTGYEVVKHDVVKSDAVKYEGGREEAPAAPVLEK
jgi:hypothetical protein